MIGYITLGTNNLEQAAEFYDELLGAFGAKRFMETERMVAWSAGEGSPNIGVCKPFDGKPASAGNGVMISLFAGAPEKVDALHAKALELGGSDEGEPGKRFGQFYGAYFRDRDGNKLCAFCMLPEEVVAG